MHTTKALFILRKPGNDHIDIFGLNTNYLDPIQAINQDINEYKTIYFYPFVSNKQSEAIEYIPNEYCIGSIDLFSDIEFSQFIQNFYLQNDCDATDFIESSKQEHLELIEAIKNEIALGNINKAIASRIITRSLTNPPSIAEVYKKLLLLNSECYAYLFIHPQSGLWMGASPEQLIHIEDHYLHTTSLAGTLPIADDYVFTAKEYEEQKIVTDQIVNSLSSLGLKSMYNPQPDIKKLRHIKHLYTAISADLNGLKIAPSTIAQVLHPTPAVGGYPQKKAVEIIQKYERHSRAYYTGYVGIADSYNADFFVNLRCMKVQSNRIGIFVGGGITAHSIADQEWEETALKGLTMLDLLADL